MPTRSYTRDAVRVGCQPKGEAMAIDQRYSAATQGARAVALATFAVALLVSTERAEGRCAEVRALLQRGLSGAEVVQATGLSPAQVHDCVRRGRNQVIQPAGPPPFGAAGPAPLGAAGPAPSGAAGPAPRGAPGPAPHGAAGPPPSGAAGPAPGGFAPR